MINLGPYPGKNCPDVHFHPTVIDRILECAALIVVLATWVGIYWLYEIEDVSLSADVWMTGGFSVFSYLFMGIAGYLPIRPISACHALYPGNDCYSGPDVFRCRF